MKKIGLVVFSLIAFFGSIVFVNGACTSEENYKLSGEAVNVRVSYEKMEGVLDSSVITPPDGLTDEEFENYTEIYEYFKIYITNLTENLYVEVYNDVTKETYTYKFQDSNNGTVSFDWKKLNTITNFTITVYSSDNTGCAGTKLYTTYLTTPMFNSYSLYSLCEGIEEFYLCHKYLSVETVEFSDFARMVEQYNKGKLDKDGDEIVEIPEEDGGFVNFVKEHKALVIGGVIAILLVGGLVTVIIVKKQRSRIV